MAMYKPRHEVGQVSLSGKKKQKMTARRRFAGRPWSKDEGTRCMNGVVRIMLRRWGNTVWTSDEQDMEEEDGGGRQVMWSEPTRDFQVFAEMKNSLGMIRTNHIPGLKQHLFKTGLCEALYSVPEEERPLFPRTWQIQNSEGLSVFQEEVKGEAADTVYIVKPGIGHQGDHIQLCTAETAKDVLAETLRRKRGAVIQDYIANPLLLDGLKFDFRVYVLVESVYPSMKLHVFHEGLARFCTVPYEKPTPENFEQSMMHLTNFSLNKTSAAFQSVPSNLIPGALHTQEQSQVELLDEAYLTASKRSVSIVLERQLKLQDIPGFWQKVDALVCSTFRTFATPLQDSFLTFAQQELGFQTDIDDTALLDSTCFQLLGVDVLLDEKCNVVLLEANNNPSMLCKRCSLDSVIKQGVMNSTLRILGCVTEEKAQEVDCWYAPYGSYTLGDEDTLPVSEN